MPPPLRRREVALGRVELAKAEGAGTYAFTSRRAQDGRPTQPGAGV